MAIEKRFLEYFEALDRSGDQDRCFLCCRTGADVKAFFGFHEDGTPIDAGAYGIEDVVLPPRQDVMSYRGTRPVCAVCQLNFDAIFLAGDKPVVAQLLEAMETRREDLWPDEE